MNLGDKLLEAAITTGAGIVQVLALAVLAAGFKTYLDVRSLRKANKALFGKVRNIEKKLFGHETSELDTRRFERSEERS